MQESTLSFFMVANFWKSILFYILGYYANGQFEFWIVLIVTTSIYHCICSYLKNQSQLQSIIIPNFLLKEKILWFIVMNVIGVLHVMMLILKPYQIK